MRREPRFTDEDRALLARCDEVIATIDRTLGAVSATLARVDALLAETAPYRAATQERAA